MKKAITGFLCSAMLLTASLPGALAAGDLLVAPAPAAPRTYDVLVGDQALDLTGKAPYQEGELIMVPVRAVAEALGYTVTWDAHQSAAMLDNGVNHTWVHIGLDSYVRTSSTALGMSAPQSFGAIPVLREGGFTFAPADLFALMGNTFTAEDGVIRFTDAGDAVQLPNPIKEYASLEEVQAVLPFAALPAALPEGYELESLSVIAGTCFQANYTDGTGRITFRMAESSQDISGDYTVYAEERTADLGGVSVTLKGGGALVGLALWRDGAVSLSVHFSIPVSADAAAALITGQK